MVKFEFGLLKSSLKSSNLFNLHDQHFKMYSDFKKNILNCNGFGDGVFVEDFIHVTNSIFHDAVESVA